MLIILAIKVAKDKIQANLNKGSRLSGLTSPSLLVRRRHPPGVIPPADIETTNILTWCKRGSCFLIKDLNGEAGFRLHLHM